MNITTLVFYHLMGTTLLVAFPQFYVALCLLGLFSLLTGG